MQFFTLQSISIATIIGFLVGFLWYGVLFTRAWLFGEGVTKHDLPKRSKLYILQINVYSLIAHGAVVSVLALIFDLLAISTYKVAISLGVLMSLGFVIAPRYIDMLYTVKGNHWSKESQIKFLVASGYYTLFIVIVSTILIFLHNA